MLVLIAFLLALIVFYCGARIAAMTVAAIFRVVVAIVMLPWYVGIGLYRFVVLGARFRHWFEAHYVAAERRARGLQ